MIFNSTGFIEMSKEESLLIEGGHDGTAYQIGKAVHTVIVLLADIAKGVLGGLL